MLIKNIKLTNFLVFHGEQYFSFPSNKDKNIVLVLANNNTGKTCLIRALKFLFYGDVPKTSDGRLGDAETMINDRHFYESKADDTLEACVEAAIEIDETEITYRRVIESSKTGKDERTRARVYLERNSPRDPRKFIKDDGNFQNSLNRMIPRGLFDAFYFQGEPLDGKLLEGVGTIRNALTSFMHLEKWQEARNALDKVKSKFDSKIATLSQTHAKYRGLVNAIQTMEENQLKRTKELAEAKAEAERMEIQLQEADHLLSQVGDTSEFDALVKQKAPLEREYRQAQLLVGRLEDDIKTAVGRTQGLPFLLGAIPKARKVLNDLVEDNVLPADVSEGFVHRILEQKTCVCGKMHTEETRLNWKEYLERTLSADVNQNLLQVLNLLEPEVEDAYPRRSRQLVESLQSLLQDAEEARKVLSEKKDALDALESQLADHPQANMREEVNRALQYQVAIRSKEQAARGRLTDLQHRKDNAENVIRQKKREAEKERPRGQAGKDIAKFEKGSEIAGNLIRFIDDFESQLKGRFYGRLQGFLRETYDENVVDRTLAKVDSINLLPSIVNHEGKKVAALGGGQQSLLALAYVVSLSRLRKEIHELMREFGVFLGRVDDQSFVIDSPFSTVDKNYVKSMADLLVSSARQNIILMANQQWDQSAQYLEPVAEKIYTMTLYTDLKELKDLKQSHFDFQIKGVSHRLIADSGSVENRFTKIEEVV